jgi:hypothetical protein
MDAIKATAVSVSVFAAVWWLALQCGWSGGLVWLTGCVAAPLVWVAVYLSLRNKPPR